MSRQVIFFELYRYILICSDDSMSRRTCKEETISPSVRSWIWPACSMRSCAARNSWMRWPREDNPWWSRNVAATRISLVSCQPDDSNIFYVSWQDWGTIAKMQSLRWTQSWFSQAKG